MATGTFTATGGSAQIGASDGQSLTVSLTGTFVARVSLQQVLGSAGYRNVQTWTAPAVEYVPISSGTYRLFCETYASGTVTYSLTVRTTASAGSGTDAYDNSVSGLAATTKQNAIDELKAMIDTINGILS